MVDSPNDPLTLLLETDRSDIVPVVQDALRDAGIPFESGLQSRPSPRIVVSVPRSRAAEARDLVSQYFGSGPLAVDEETPPPPASEGLARGPVAVAAGLVLLHLTLVLALAGPSPSAARLARIGGLPGGAGLGAGPRLVTYMFLHSSVPHVLWNGISLLVFTVPLVGLLGYARTGAIYLAAGVLGGLAATLTTDAAAVTVGSSGAVAGLFGAWLSLQVRRSRRSTLPGRAWIRVAGIGLLALPSLLTPTTPEGSRISVAAHLGGLAAGLIAGALARERTLPADPP